MPALTRVVALSPEHSSGRRTLGSRKHSPASLEALLDYALRGNAITARDVTAPSQMEQSADVGGGLLATRPKRDLSATVARLFG